LYEADSARIAHFMSAYYGDTEWKLDKPRFWMPTYLSDKNIICLGLIDNKTNEILATIFSTPFSGGITRMTHSISKYDNVRVIEGLCVHNSLRKKGVAGIMIHHMDIITHSLFGPTIHLWSRELHVVPLIHTALTMDIYGYKICKTDVYKCTHLEKIDYDIFVRLWVDNCEFWNNEPAIIACIPQNRRGGISVFKHKDLIVVITNTFRHSNEKQIYEIVWCGKIIKDRLYPSSQYNNYKLILNCISCLPELNQCILFGSSSPTGGGLSYEFEEDGWVYGRSGAHAWYIYNYMPPSFHNCRIYNIRDEL
jgi:glycosyltransferase involved in cell wall biosynthesis